MFDIRSLLVPTPPSESLKNPQRSMKPIIDWLFEIGITPSQGLFQATALCFPNTITEDGALDAVGRRNQ